ncbi:helix-turn-helix transcriptional regulator [Roseovarius aestuariivivens]|uniref:helix-turn-helix transcriptional regulator n=1 Tax=Roseovarius aestuariivivens TaxID=1888910 RepID=UPI00108156F8|nr:helix-turn-helix domain-containing protein [Roseovarius aestuariivivens]
MSEKEQSDLKLLTRLEVEAEYGIGKRYLEVAATRSEGPAYIKIGRSVRYRREDLERWILEQRVETCAARSTK